MLVVVSFMLPLSECNIYLTCLLLKSTKSLNFSLFFVFSGRSQAYFHQVSLSLHGSSLANAFMLAVLAKFYM